MSSYDDVAHIIGNGQSRKDFDLDLLRGKGTSFGCNALYRDWEPDYLVAIDQPIIDEINASGFPWDRFIVPPWTECYEPREFNPRQPRSNAGMNAMIEAIRKDNTQLFCFGFDFLIANEDQLKSNMYDGTNAYGPETRTNVSDSLNRIKYLNWFAHKNEQIEFVFVFPAETPLNTTNITASNIKWLSYNDFIAAISED